MARTNGVWQATVLDRHGRRMTRSGSYEDMTTFYEDHRDRGVSFVRAVG